MTALYACILRDPPAPLASAPPALEAVVLRCLEKDPNQRFRNTAELAQALVPFGSAAAQASANSIARVVESGLEMEDPVAVSHRLASSPTPRRLAPRLAELSTTPSRTFSSSLSAARIPMRAPIVGYLLGAAILVAAGGAASWALMHNRDALVAATASLMRPGAPTPAIAPPVWPALASVQPPPVPTATGSAVTTTSAVTNGTGSETVAAPEPAREKRAHRAHVSRGQAPRSFTAPVPSAAVIAPPPPPGADDLFDERK
jgi:serine/threonine-protein kinase